MIYLLSALCLIKTTFGMQSPAGLRQMILEMAEAMGEDKLAAFPQAKKILEDHKRELQKKRGMFPKKTGKLQEIELSEEESQGINLFEVDGRYAFIGQANTDRDSVARFFLDDAVAFPSQAFREDVLVFPRYAKEYAESKGMYIGDCISAKFTEEQKALIYATCKQPARTFSTIYTREMIDDLNAKAQQGLADAISPSRYGFLAGDNEGKFGHRLVCHVVSVDGETALVTNYRGGSSVYWRFPLEESVNNAINGKDVYRTRHIENFEGDLKAPEREYDGLYYDLEDARKERRTKLELELQNLPRSSERAKEIKLVLKELKKPILPRVTTVLSESQKKKIYEN